MAPPGEHLEQLPGKGTETGLGLNSGRAGTRVSREGRGWEEEVMPKGDRLLSCPADYCREDSDLALSGILVFQDKIETSLLNERKPMVQAKESRT